MKKTALALIVAAGCLWGTSCIFVNFLSPHGINTLQMTVSRGFIAFLCMAIYAFIKDKSLFKPKPRELLLFAAIGITLFVTATSYYSAMQLTGVSVAVVLMYTAPVYVAVFSTVFWKEKISKLKITAIAMLLIGCALSSGMVSGFDANIVGIIFGIISGVSYATYNLLTKVALKRGNDPVGVSMFAFLTMFLISLPISNPVDLVSKISLAPAEILLGLLGMGIFTFVLPYFLYTLSMKTLSASTATALSIVEPLAATVYSIAFFGERPDVFMIAGIVLALAAVVLIGACKSPNATSESEKIY